MLEKCRLKELSEGAIKGMTNALDDPYTEYYYSARKTIA